MFAAPKDALFPRIRIKKKQTTTNPEVNHRTQPLLETS